MSKNDIPPELHLVLLPGLDGTGSLFNPFIKQFADPSQITVISYPMKHHIPFEQMHEYIIPMLPTDKPLVILGESYSGPIALSLAARGDIAIHKIILVATFAKYPNSILKTLAKALPLSFLLRIPIPDFIIRHYCFGSAGTQVLRAQLRDAIKANKPAVLARRARDGSGVDVTGLLANITVPCLYLAASDDKLVSHKAVDYLMKHLPGLSVITVQGPHFILQAEPKACFNLVDNFLNATKG